MKDSFVLYTKYQAQMKLLDMAQRGMLFTAIMAYVAGEELPEMDAVVAMAFSFIRADLDRDAERYEKTCEVRREAGAKGGRPKTVREYKTVDGRDIPMGEVEGKHFLYLIYDTNKCQYKIGETGNLFMRRYHIKRPTNDLVVLDYYIGEIRECKQYEKEVLHEYKEYSIGGDWFDLPEDKVEEIICKWFAKKANGSAIKQKVNEKPDNEYEYDNDLKEKTTKVVQKKSVFQPPTLTEVQSYASQSGLDIDAEKFIDFYASKGWLVGKVKMKDWKAAVRNWCRRERESPPDKGKTRFSNFPQRSYDYDALEQQLIAAEFGGMS